MNSYKLEIEETSMEAVEFFKTLTEPHDSTRAIKHNIVFKTIFK